MNFSKTFDLVNKGWNGKLNDITITKRDNTIVIFKGDKEVNCITAEELSSQNWTTETIKGLDNFFIKFKYGYREKTEIMIHKYSHDIKLTKYTIGDNEINLAEFQINVDSKESYKEHYDTMKNLINNRVPLIIEISLTYNDDDDISYWCRKQILNMDEFNKEFPVENIMNFTLI